MSELARSRVTYTQSTVSSATSTDNVVTFNINISFEAKDGDLPEGVTGVFVKQVLVPSDPKADRFLRIATLADLGRTAVSRERALDPVRFRPAGATYIMSRDDGPSLQYLSPTLSLAFDNLQVAIQAKSAIEQRIDALIADWKSFKSEYVSVTQAEFPLADAAIVAAAKQRYYSAITAYVTALNAKKTATQALADAQFTLSVKNIELARIKTMQAAICDHVGNFLTYDTAYSAYISGTNGRQKLLNALALAKSYVASNASDLSYEPTRAAIQAAIAAELSAYATLETLQSQNYVLGRDKMVLACNTLDGQFAAANQEVIAATSAVSTASADLQTATGAANSARTEKTSAYNDLMVKCPAYDPAKDDELPPMGEWESVILG